MIVHLKEVAVSGKLKRELSVICDACGTHAKAHGYLFENGVVLLQSIGWESRRTDDYCPKCKENPLKKRNRSFTADGLRAKHKPTGVNNGKFRRRARRNPR